MVDKPEGIKNIESSSIHLNPMTLTPLQKANAAFALISDRNKFSDPLAELIVQQRILRKFKPDSYDFEKQSLQKRWISFLKAECGLTDETSLCEIDESRKAVFMKITRASLLGNHAENAEVTALGQGFSDDDLYCLYMALAEPSRFRSKRVIDIISEKLRAGRGLDLILYLAQLHKNSKRRTKRSSTKLMNPVALAASMVWTDPDCPLWLLPSKTAISYMRLLIGPHQLSLELYNKTVERYGLQRLDQKVMDRFLSKVKSDPAAFEIAHAIAKICGTPLVAARRGRPSS